MGEGNKWFVIVNPNAGIRLGEKDWNEIAYLLTEAGIDYTNVFTDAPLHAIKLAKKYIEAGYRKIIVVGGDGTLNEVINGVVKQKRFAPDEVIVAMIPVGTGNDWCRTFKIPENYKEAIKVIAKCKTARQDIGMIRYDVDGSECTRYFLNMAGIGFDGAVAKRTNRLKAKGKGGPLSYLINLFTTLLSHKATLARIIIDNKPYEEEAFTISVAIGQFNGGGMKQAPSAITDDGLFDITLIRHVTRMTVLRNIKKLYDGSYVTLKQVKQFRGKIVRIEAEPPLIMEADGESLGSTPMVFEIMPRCITVVSG